MTRISHGHDFWGADRSPALWVSATVAGAVIVSGGPAAGPGARRRAVGVTVTVGGVKERPASEAALLRNATRPGRAGPGRAVVGPGSAQLPSQERV